MNKWLKFLLGLGISFAGLYYAFQKTDFRELIEAIAGMNFPLILAAVAIMLFSVAVRAERWRLILNPIEKISFHPLFGSTMVGYFGNSVLPFRLGEVLRAFSIGESSALRPSAAFGTILLERVLDMLGLVALFLIFMPGVDPTVINRQLLAFVGIMTVLIFLIVIWLGRSHSQFHERIVHLKIFETGFGKKLLSTLTSLIDGITALKKTHHTGTIIFHTGFLWVLYYLSVYLAMAGAGISLSWTGVGVLLIATTLVITVPSAPGYVGTYHAAAVYIVHEIYQIGLTDAQAFSVILHAIGFVPLVTIGGFYFLRGSVRFRDLETQEVTA